MNPLAKILVGPVFSFLEKRAERKAAKTAIKAKTELARAGQNHEQTLTDQEWEEIAVALTAQSWKDEYITIIITLPIPAMFIGTIYYAVTGDYRLMEGVVSGVQALEALDIDYGFLMEAVVLAALGLTVWRKTTR